MSQTLKTADTRLQLVMTLGGRCEDCQFDIEPRVLRLTRRDGLAETTKGGGAQWYARLIKIQNNPHDYKVLCPTCLAIGQLEVNRTIIWNATTIPIDMITKSQEYKKLLKAYGDNLFIVTYGRVYNHELVDVGDGREFLESFGDVPEGVSVHISRG